MASVKFARRSKSGRIKKIDLEELEELIQDDEDENNRLSSENRDDDEQVIFQKFPSSTKNRSGSKATTFQDEVKRVVIKRWEQKRRVPPCYVYLPWGAIRVVLFYTILISWLSVLTYVILESTIWKEQCDNKSVEGLWWLRGPILDIQSAVESEENLSGLFSEISTWGVSAILLKVNSDGNLEVEKIKDILSKCHEKGINVVLKVDVALFIDEAPEVLCNAENETGSKDHIKTLLEPLTNVILELLDHRLDGLFIQSNQCMEEWLLSNWTTNQINTTDSFLLIGGSNSINHSNGFNLMQVTIPRRVVTSAESLLTFITSHLDKKGTLSYPLWDINRSSFNGSELLLQRLLLLQVFLPGVAMFVPSDLKINFQNDNSNSSIYQAVTLLNTTPALQTGEMIIISKKIQYLEANLFAIIRTKKKKVPTATLR